MFGASDDRARPCDLVVRAGMCSGRPGRSTSATACSSGLLGNAGPERAALCLCQPLVRPAARLGARADRERAIHLGRALAADLRARDRELRLAQHDARCSACSRSPSIVPLAALFLKHPPEVDRRRRAAARQARAADRARLAAQSRVRHAGGRGVLLLRADGDAAGASRRALQRSRHQADARRRDAVGAARHRVLQPPDVGLDLRPHRRAA